MKSNIRSVLITVIIMIFTCTISVSAIEYGSYGSENNYDVGISDLSINDLMDYLIEMFGSSGKIVFFILLVFSALGCFYGYKIYKFFIGFCGFLIGGELGLLLAIEFDSLVWLVIGIFLAIGFAIIGFKFYQIGLFILGFVNAFPLSAITFLCFSNNIEVVLIVSIIISAAAGILVIKLKKPIIILSSAVTYGNLLGMWLACLIANTGLAGLFRIIFVCAGIYVQTRINNGLLESGSFIQWVKNKRGGKKSETGLSSTINKTSKKCKYCGADILAESVFCEECGRNLQTSEPVNPVNVYKTERLETPSAYEPKKEIDKAFSTASSVSPEKRHITESLSFPKSEKSDTDCLLNNAETNENPALKGDLSSDNHSLVINLNSKNSETVKHSSSNGRFKQSSDFD